jgi:hypothetical protein
MSDKYTLMGKTPVPATDLIEWARWLETADRTVRQDQIGEVKVSTVFLGLDHNWSDGPPILFETMVFGGEHDGECERYSTWEEAEAGHVAVLLRITTPAAAHE